MMYDKKAQLIRRLTQPSKLLPYFMLLTFKMSTTATMTKTPISASEGVFAHSTGNLETWQEDLRRDGFAVVKGAVPLDRIQSYRDEMMSWLEGL
jgi:hypothetical protein